MLKKYADSASDAEQAVLLTEGVNIVISTVGQLINFINQRVLDLRQLDHFVIDEADQLLLPRADQRPKSLKPGARFRAMEFFGGLNDLTQ